MTAHPQENPDAYEGADRGAELDARKRERTTNKYPIADADSATVLHQGLGDPGKEQGGRAPGARGPEVRGPEGQGPERQRARGPEVRGPGGQGARGAGGQGARWPGGQIE